MSKPTMSMCVNLTDYHKQTIKWQSERITELEEALRQARAVMLKAAEDKEAGRMWNISYPLSAAAAKIASVLDNTEESRDE